MILYFSGTGNTYAVAKAIADATDEKLLDMGMACRAVNFEIEVEQGDMLGFAFPTHRWCWRRAA